MADIFVTTGADPVVNGANLQTAIDDADPGDNIILEAGAEYWTTDAPFYAPFTCGAKGGTTEADYITIKTDALASLPVDVRVGLSDVVHMAKIVSRGPGGAFLFTDNATYWKLAGLEITNVSSGISSQHTNTFVNIGATGTAHIWTDRCYIHPQEDGTATLGRTASHGIVVSSPPGGGVTIIYNTKITNCRISGFGGTYAHDLGQVIDAIGIATNVLDTIIVDNNFISAGYQPWFPAGADITNASIGVVQASPAPTLTSCTLSNVSGLVVGQLVSFDQPPNVQSFGTANIETIVGNAITYSSIKRGYGDTPVAPASGANCYWNGAVGKNYTVTHNTMEVEPVLAQLVYDATSSNPKGWMEWKMGENVWIEGNIFQGRATGFAISAVNQGGGTPWVTVKDFTFKNNWFKNFSVALNMQFGNPVPTVPGDPANDEGSNILFENNLFTQNNTLPGDLGVTKLAQIAKGIGVTFRHNSVAMNPTFDGAAFTMIQPITNLTFVDNIYYWSRYGLQCYTGTLGDCVPGWTDTNNVILNDLQIQENSALEALLPNDFVATNDNETWTGLDHEEIEDWRLQSDSPYKGQASDDTDPGVNIDQLIAALAGATSEPGPEPDPTIILLGACLQ